MSDYDLIFNPALVTKTNFYPGLESIVESIAKIDPDGISNIPTGTKRIVNVTRAVEQWNGTAWQNVGFLSQSSQGGGVTHALNYRVNRYLGGSGASDTNNGLTAGAAKATIAGCLEGVDPWSSIFIFVLGNITWEDSTSFLSYDIIFQRGSALTTNPTITISSGNRRFVDLGRLFQLFRVNLSCSMTNQLAIAGARFVASDCTISYSTATGQTASILHCSRIHDTTIVLNNVVFSITATGSPSENINIAGEGNIAAGITPSTSVNAGAIIDYRVLNVTNPDPSLSIVDPLGMF